MIKWALVSAWISFNSFPGQEVQCVVVRTETACHIARGMEKTRLEGYFLSEISQCVPVKPNDKLDENCIKGDF